MSSCFHFSFKAFGYYCRTNQIILRTPKDIKNDFKKFMYNQWYINYNRVPQYSYFGVMGNATCEKNHQILP